MNAENTYSFVTINLKAPWFLAVILLVIPFGFLLNTMHLSKATGQWVFLSILGLFVILPITLFFIFLRKKETVTVYADHLESKRFGKIFYRDIKRLSSLNQRAKPNMLLVLHNGKKYKWVPQVNREINAQECEKLIDTLSTCLQTTSSSETKLENTSESVSSSNVFSGNNSGNTSNWKGNSPVIDTDSGTDEGGLSGLAALGKKAMPYAGLLLLLGIGAQFLIKYNGKQHRKKDAQKVVNALNNSEEIKNQLLDYAFRELSKYAKKEGPFYVLTNDSDMAFHYLPQELFGEIKDPLITAKSVMENPAASQWKMSVRLGGKNYIFHKNEANKTDRSATYIYILAVTPSIKSPQNQQAIKTKKRLSQAVALLIDNQQLTKSFEANFDKISYLVKQFPDSTKLYMAAQEGEGKMNATLFKKYEQLLKNELAKRKIDTLKFNAKTLYKQ